MYTMGCVTLQHAIAVSDSNPVQRQSLRCFLQAAAVCEPLSLLKSKDMSLESASFVASNPSLAILVEASRLLARQVTLHHLCFRSDPFTAFAQRVTLLLPTEPHQAHLFCLSWSK